MHSVCGMVCPSLDTGHGEMEMINLATSTLLLRNHLYGKSFAC